MGTTVGTAGAPNGAAILTTAGGGTWTPQVIPPTAGSLSSISCSDPRQCVAVGQAASSSNGQGIVLTTADGGRSWQSRPIPPGFLDVTAVACRPDRRCMAIGEVPGGAAALSSSSAGAAWVQRGNLPPGLNGATGLSCPDDSQCWATVQRASDPDHVAGVVAVTTDGGSAWRALAVPGGIGYLNDIACPTPGKGYTAIPTSTAAPATTAAPAPNGHSPAAGSTPAAGPSPAALAGAQCVVVGTTSGTLNAARAGHGVLLTTADGGRDWSERSVPALTASLFGVSCTGRDSCVMVGSTVSTSTQAGTILLTGPASDPWKSLAAVGAPLPLTGVDCVSQSRCLVVGESISEHLTGG